MRLAARAGFRHASRRLSTLAALAAALLAAPPAAGEWQRFGEREGVPPGTVRDLIQDRSGNLWVCSDGGVSRYDGVNWSSWTFPALRDPYLNAGGVVALEARDGAIWVGTGGGGIVRYDGSGWTGYGPADGLPHDAFQSALQDRAGNLWFGSDRGLARFDGQAWRTFRQSDGLATDNVRRIVEDTAGNLWFLGPYGGLSRFDGATWRTFTTADGLSSNFIAEIAADDAGGVWVAGYDVNHYDGTAWTPHYQGGGLIGGLKTALFTDRAGNVWTASYSSASRYDGSTWKAFGTADGMTYGNVVTIFQDREGEVWFGSEEAGVSRYDGAWWRAYTRADGLAGSAVHKMMEDVNGSLWFVNYELEQGTGRPTGSLTRFDKTEWRSYSGAGVLPHDAVFGALEDRAGNVWFAHEQFAGVSRFDGRQWRTFSSSDGLPDGTISAMHLDRLGRVWVGGYYGVSRFDGTSWRRYPGTDSSLILPCCQVSKIVEDRAGNLWFATPYGGIARFDGASWTTYNPGVVSDIHADRSGSVWATISSFGPIRFDGTTWHYYSESGLFGANVGRILEDSTGVLWFGTYGQGIASFDGATWRQYGTGSGLASNYVSQMAADREGGIWVTSGFPGAVSHYDGAGWRTVQVPAGQFDQVNSVLPDRSGTVWFGTHAGVARLTGGKIVLLNTDDGLVHNTVRGTLEDRVGRIWILTFGGASLHSPDRVAPQTRLSPPPLPVTSSRSLTASFRAVFDDARDAAYSASLDGMGGPAWTTDPFWQASGLADGAHLLHVRARDRWGNADPVGATALFEVDATSPAPVISSPGARQALRDSVTIQGTAADARFQAYRVDVRPAGATTWQPPDATQLALSTVPVESGTIAGWNTRPFPDGEYDIRLAVIDTLGLTGSTLVRAVVDNHPPFDEVTSPARVSAASGGDVFTTRGEAHVYFPPHALDQDALVTLEPLAESDVPASLPDGATRLLPGFALDWTAAALVKAATLEVSLQGAAAAGSAPAGAAGTPVLYLQQGDGTWTRAGGTVEGGPRIALAVQAPARYAVFAGGTAPPGPSALSAPILTPRVFSPRGGFARPEVAISFTLGRAGSATVKVFNRAGRLVRSVADGQPFGGGANLVRWDGRDTDGDVVPSGIYLVTVEALGETRNVPLAVVR